ncbi:hypothetical protein K493DRAFT_393760 [Basidiobolus meristosporus CBS 931.73]|uniref:Apple domain-containing protein n=1 Tax=Basidiobolus meristosporus CBS 931.73 TaxID=1314790 RepID=A0A1Y1WQS1_9FUNG|nr:hypothetical protein K493DRAFT_393760 [Basidiobolus meristosporus CBS 931.73]|eukprot:ORX75883.1 hypothetical protein K493DRAFT_393760 [Basidiobolus meristosporus CBS 931.73]
MVNKLVSYSVVSISANLTFPSRDKPYGTKSQLLDRLHILVTMIALQLPYNYNYPTITLRLPLFHADWDFFALISVSHQLLVSKTLVWLKYMAKQSRKLEDSSVESAPITEELETSKPCSKNIYKLDICHHTAPDLTGIHQPQLAHSYETYPEFAVALKTGRDVVASRCPIQTSTFLSRVKNLIVIAESSEVSLGDIPVYDVYSSTQKPYRKSRRSPQLEYLGNKTHSLKKRESDAIVIDQDSLGWKLDAHKNIPGMRLLYEKFPNAECRPPLSWIKHCFHWSTTAFDRYHDCWGGDIRLALCLRDAGVLLQGQSGFHSDPPNTKFSFKDRDPCERPITFHHLLPHQVQLLYEADKKMHGDVTYSDVVDRFSRLKSNITSQHDRPGHDYKTLTISLAECQAQCENDKLCQSWSHSNGSCKLKDSMPDMTEVKDEKTFTNSYPLHYTCANR